MMYNVKLFWTLFKIHNATKLAMKEPELPQLAAHENDKPRLAVPAVTVELIPINTQPE